jgi:dienelactone hydrolase
MARPLALLIIALALLAGPTVGAARSPLQFPGITTLKRPPGDGPFPAVVLLHTCAGVSAHMYEWADRLQEAGYVALVVNSLLPRKVGMNCGNWTVSVDDVAGDALAARTYLRTLPFVDPGRIGAMGFSYGGMAGLRLASLGYMRNRAEASEGAFRAVIAVYPFCTVVSRRPADFNLQNNLYDDIGIPLHILIGGADDETDPVPCAAKVSALAGRGQPVSHKVYPGVTHAFDQSSFLGTRVRGYFYKYDATATKDAEAEMRTFFGKHLKGEP